eukprot:9880816-Alexandrium_andersonii.AAC.1
MAEHKQRGFLSSRITLERCPRERGSFDAHVNDASHDLLHTSKYSDVSSDLGVSGSGRRRATQIDRDISVL